MSVWWISSLALSIAAAVPAVLAGIGRTATRFVALQLLGSVASLILITLCFALDQSSCIDLPLALAFMSLPGVLVCALFLERWL